MRHIQLFKAKMDTGACITHLYEPLATGWLGRGPLVEEFENQMAGIVGQKHFIATSSCTAALQIACSVVSQGGDPRFASTPITFVSTNAAIKWTNWFSPYWLDVDPMTGMMLAPRDLPISMKAMMIVHLGGKPWDGWVPEGVTVVEDCAHALGSQLPPARGLRCWSFHAVKNLPMGDGGGISTDDAEMADRLRRLRWLGISRDTAQRHVDGYEWRYEIKELGFKAAMNDLQAAIGLAMIPHLESHNKRRKEIARHYGVELGAAFDERSSCHFVPLIVNERDKVAMKLKEVGIETSVHYQRNDLYEPFERCCTSGDLRGADFYEKHEITLPLHPGLTDEDVEYVVENVKRFRI